MGLLTWFFIWLWGLVWSFVLVYSAFKQKTKAQTFTLSLFLGIIYGFLFVILITN